jgi:hypothetical protein
MPPVLGKRSQISALPIDAAVQDERGTPLTLGFGLEGNMNTIDGASAAVWLAAARDLGRSFSAGLKTGYSRNITNISTLEMAALGRWYFVSSEKSRFFAQLELGADLIFYEERTIPAFLGGLILGCHFPIASWYVEPALRGGYPYIWGLSISFGRRI